MTEPTPPEVAVRVDTSDLEALAAELEQTVTAIAEPGAIVIPVALLPAGSIVRVTITVGPGAPAPAPAPEPEPEPAPERRYLGSRQA